jgi:hypothetical protein
MGLEQYKVLQHKVMTAMVQAFTQPILRGKTMFPDQPILTNTAEWDVVRSSRTLAQFSVPGTAAKIVALMSQEKKTSTTAHIFQKKIIPGAVMAWLRQPGTEHQQMGERKVADEIQDLDLTVEHLKEWARWQVLTTGKLIINQPDIKANVDFQVANSHLPQPDVSWDDEDHDAPIIENLRAWRTLVNEDCGEVVTRMIVSEDVMSAMISNNGVYRLMGDQLKTQILKTGYITQMLGMEIELYTATYKDSNNATQTYLPKSKILLTAGTGFAEEQTAPSTDPKSGFRPGKFSKSWEQEDPPQVMASIEDNLLPVLKKPDNILCANVIFGEG